jgi:hypothetical protein
MRRMGMQLWMRRIQSNSCIAQEKHSLRRRPEWVPMRRMGTRILLKLMTLTCIFILEHFLWEFFK